MVERLIKPTMKPSYLDKKNYIASLMTTDRIQLPLERVSVESVILEGIVSSVVVQEFYYAGEKDALEVIYTFPLSANASIVRFEAKINDQISRSVVHEKGFASELLENARRKKHFASMVTQERDHIYKMILTRIPPQTRVRIEFQLVESLIPVMGEYQYRFPTVIPEYFMPGQAISHESEGTHPDTTIVPDASRISPPIQLDHKVPFHFKIRLLGDVHEIKSSMHLLAEEKIGDQVILTPAVAEQNSLNGDLQIYYRYQNTQKLKAYYQDEFLLLQIPTQALLTQKRPRRLLICMDISGSMDGSKLEALQEASISLLKTLSAQDRFQLLKFNTHAELAFDRFQTYDNQNLEVAETWINQLYAGGGTDIRLALDRSINAFKEDESQYEDLILLVTDGQSGDESSCIQLAKQNRIQIFTLGIDSAVNDSLLQKIARYSGAVCELCTPKDDLEHIVNRLSPSLHAPLLNNVHIKSDLKIDGDQAAKKLFINQSTMLVIKSRESWNEKAVRDLEISANHYEYEKCFKVEEIQEIRALPELNLNQQASKILPYIWAKDQMQTIAEMIVEHSHIDKIVALKKKQLWFSKEYQLICDQTALFVSIEEITSDGTLKKIIQSVEKARYQEQSLFESHASLAMPMFSLGFAQSPQSPQREKSRIKSKKRESSSSSFSNRHSNPHQTMNYRSEYKDSGYTYRSQSQFNIPTQQQNAPEKRITLLSRADGSLPGGLVDHIVAIACLLICGHTRISGDRSIVMNKICQYLQSNEDQYRLDPYFPVYQWMIVTLESVEKQSSDIQTVKPLIKEKIDTKEIQNRELLSIYESVISLV